MRTGLTYEGEPVLHIADVIRVRMLYAVRESSDAAASQSADDQERLCVLAAPRREALRGCDPPEALISDAES